MTDTELKQIEGLTVKEVAYILQVAEKTIYSWIADGKLPAFKIGGNIRVKKENVGAMQHSI